MVSGKFWLHSIHGIYQTSSGALASTALLDHEGSSSEYRALCVGSDKYKHVLWNPEAAHKTESNLTKFLNRHPGEAVLQSDET